LIFVTVGASPFPFDRMLRGVGELPGERLFVQHGPAEPPAGVARSVDFLSFAELIEAVATADVVVSHAGAGSVICALKAGHTPVLVPRLQKYGETVDDHQLELARALEADGRALVAWDSDGIAEAVAAVPPRRSAEPERELPIHRALRRALLGLDPLPG
jgi:UDP-N-acetylglucosamine transferase subunit ALG13